MQQVQQLLRTYFSTTLTLANKTIVYFLKKKNTKILFQKRVLPNTPGQIQ